MTYASVLDICLANGVKSQDSLDRWSYRYCPNFPQARMITHQPFEFEISTQSINTRMILSKYESSCMVYKRK